ncbi:hypothetical protein KCP77_21090 [Salmonella enterica subsp. enterica]|nr:hypothetical protein KCP77_21090 [Salmonella enterica subsp. enterica]
MHPNPLAAGAGALVHTLQKLRLAESDADDKTYTLQQAETALGWRRRWCSRLARRGGRGDLWNHKLDRYSCRSMVKDETGRCWNCLRLAQWRLPGRRRAGAGGERIQGREGRDWAIHANRWACLCWPGRPVSVKPKPLAGGGYLRR